MKKLIIGVSLEILFDTNKVNSSTFCPAMWFQLIKRLMVLNRSKSIFGIIIFYNKRSEYQILKESIKHHSLMIEQENLLLKKNISKQIVDHNITLYLSTNREEVQWLIQNGCGAGLPLQVMMDEVTEEEEFRFAFDFDGVIADDESEIIFENNNKSYEAFFKHELKNATIPLNPGPLANFLKLLSHIRECNRQKNCQDQKLGRIHISIITSRNLRTIERPLQTLKNWGIHVDDIFVMGGQNKSGVLKAIKPHLYMDDQLKNLEERIKNVCLIHIPFGIKNKELF